MSDGGAQVIVAVGEGVVQLAGFRVGRVVLWFTAAWLSLCAITAHSDSSLTFFIAGFVALAALIGGFLSDRRKRAERAALRQALMFIGLVVVSLVGGVFLAVRKKHGEEGPPPTEAEIDALL